MKIFTCTDHEGHYPVGTASVIIAKDEEEARDLLRAELILKGLSPDGFTLQKVSQTKPIAIILDDGNY